MPIFSGIRAVRTREVHVYFLSRVSALGTRKVHVDFLSRANAQIDFLLVGSTATQRIRVESSRFVHLLDPSYRLPVSRVD